MSVVCACLAIFSLKIGFYNKKLFIGAILGNIFNGISIEC